MEPSLSLKSIIKELRFGELTGLIILFAFLAALYFAESVLLIKFLVSLLRKKPRKKPAKPIVILHALTLASVLCLAYGFFIEPYWVETKIIEIATPKLNKTSFRIAQISDLHCDRGSVNEKRIPDIINKLKPDIVVFTGDALNTSLALPVFQDTLKRINAGIKYAVRGNVDARYWPKINLFKNSGFKELNNKRAAVVKNGETIFLYGMNYTYQKINPAMLQNSAGKNFKIFLYHSSALIEYARNNVDLYLSGHTHGGQVSLPFYGAIITLSKYGKKYESGIYHIGSTILYVNRGLGMDMMPAPKIRFFARPEITIFDIKPVSDKQVSDK
jgi:predicted MPP superfamily phosphohydrolase